MSWRDEALCADLGPGIWFAHAQTKQGQHAIKICSSCPVKKACLDEALTLEAGAARRVGIWAGLGPYERAAQDS